MKKKITETKWYPYAVAACIAVSLYVLLVHLSTILEGIGTFLGYFRTVFIGLILAYIINPLAKWLNRKLFSRLKRPKLEWILSVALSVVIILAFLSFVLGTVVPQLVESFTMLVHSMDNYIGSVKSLIDRWGLSETVDVDKFLSESGGLVKEVQSYLTNNASNILNAGAQAGRSIGTWAIAFILSVYVLLNKDYLKNGVLRLMHALFPAKRLKATLKFLSRCDHILVRYIVFTLLDAIIVGVANAIFMGLTKMEFIGIVSLVVAVCNLVPTFGPIVGCVIGAFILLLVNPVHAVAFVIFTFILQFFDAYIIKPKIFGDSLGVPGLLILISVIVFGSMFGVTGMLFAIPGAAIIQFVYKEALMPWLEKRAAAREEKA